MGIFTNVFFEGFNSFLGIAIIITVFAVLWSIIAGKYVSVFNWGKKLTAVIVIAPFIAWILYFSRNIFLSLLQNATYRSIIVAIVIIFLAVVFTIPMKRGGKKWRI